MEVAVTDLSTDIHASIPSASDSLDFAGQSAPTPRPGKGMILALSIVAGALLGLLVGGCGDMLTYSKDARAQGLKLYNQQSYADAAGAFRSAIRQDPVGYANYYSLGQCYDQIGQWRESIAAYRSGWDV